MSLTNARDHIKSAGIAEWKVKAAGDAAYYSLGHIAGGAFITRTLNEKDGKGRQYPFAIEIEAKAKLLNTDASAVISLLNRFVGLNVHHIITTVNGQTFSSENVDAGTGHWGVQWRLVSDKDMDGVRFVEFKANRRLKLSEWTAVQAQPPAPGTPDPDDVLYALSGLTRSGILPAGLMKIEIKESEAQNWTDELGYFRNGKFESEMLTIKDSAGRSAGHSIRISVEAEMLQSHSTELSGVLSLAERENDYRITFADGAMSTLASKLGIQWEFRNEDDAAQSSIMKIRGEGIIQSAQWTGIWS